MMYGDFKIELGDSHNGRQSQAKSQRLAVQSEILLKGELKKRNFSYANLTKKLGAIGVKGEERNISNKIGRGSFTAVFFVQCLEAIGCKTIHLNDS
jgi:hypothetical protein